MPDRHRTLPYQHLLQLLDRLPEHHRAEWRAGMIARADRIADPAEHDDWCQRNAAIIEAFLDDETDPEADLD